MRVILAFGRYWVICAVRVIGGHWVISAVRVIFGHWVIDSHWHFACH